MRVSLRNAERCTGPGAIPEHEKEEEVHLHQDAVLQGGGCGKRCDTVRLRPIQYLRTI